MVINQNNRKHNFSRNNNERLKKIRNEKLKYKAGLLLESFFPTFLGNTHSIPDVAGPLKIVTDFMFLVMILFAVVTGIKDFCFGILFFAASSISITIALYNIDFDENLYNELTSKEMELSEFENVDINENNKSKTNNMELPNRIVSNILDNDNYEECITEQNGKAKILVKRRKKLG